MNTPQFKRFHQVGFTLVELMVSIVIGLLIVLALITLVVNVSNSNNEMSKTNRTIENGRFALQLLESDLVHAGYWGGFVPSFDNLTMSGVPTDVPTAVPNPCLAYATPWTTADKSNLLGISIQAYGATPPSGTGCVTNFATNKKANTDVLVVRHADTCGLQWNATTSAWVADSPNCEADVTGQLYFQASQCELESATPFVLSTTGLTLHKRTCIGTGTPPALPITSTDLADKRAFISNIYYVRDYANTVGDGIPTLMRSQFGLAAGTLAHQAAQPMIEGIEAFRLELGIDTASDSGADITTPYGTVPAGVNCSNASDAKFKCSIDWAVTTPANTSPTNRGDGIPDDAFVHCTDAIPCTAEQLTNVVAVKLYVLVRSDKLTPGYTDTKTYAMGTATPTSAPTLGPFNDGYKRHLFTQTIRLTNISSRRETP